MDSDNKYGVLSRQLELLQMMKDIHKFLVDNKIQYSLSGGSMLGAVREKGFIPWDDDIDIMVDRHNYERFLDVCSNLKGYKVVKLLWTYRIQRIDDNGGEWNIPTIDIFVFDNVPDNKLLYKYKLFLISFMQGMLKKKPKKKNLSKYSVPQKFFVYTTHFFGKFFTTDWKQKQYEKISMIGNKKNTSYIGIFNDLYIYTKIKYKKELTEKSELHIFENEKFSIYSEYDHYLTTVYGDYMTPPPEEDRRPSHLS